MTMKHINGEPRPLRPRYTLAELREGLADHVRWSMEIGNASEAEKLAVIRDQLSAIGRVSR